MTKFLIRVWDVLSGIKVKNELTEIGKDIIERHKLAIKADKRQREFDRIKANENWNEKYQKIIRR